MGHDEIEIFHQSLRLAVGCRKHENPRKQRHGNFPCRRSIRSCPCAFPDSVQFLYRKINRFLISGSNRTEGRRMRCHDSILRQQNHDFIVNDRSVREPVCYGGFSRPGRTGENICSIIKGNPRGMQHDTSPAYHRVGQQEFQIREKA